MDGFIAVTDRGWYEHLSQLGSNEANFWRPSIRPFRFAEGTPFFFKLKAPDRAIVGLGFYAGFSVLPDWLAWETFGEANGVDTLASLRDRLRRVQLVGRIQADPAGQIGCCLIAETHFFRADDWVQAPSDWHPRTQVGATYNLAVGEGLRVWQECVARANSQAAAAPDRYGAPALFLPRLGQGIFRVRVLDAHGRACAVTQEHSLPVLEAAHIQPFAVGGSHRVTNGLALEATFIGCSTADTSRSMMTTASL
jgi:putative restriction endonuclease